MSASARDQLLNLMAEWGMRTQHGSRRWADRILRRHRDEVADQLGRELMSAGIEPFIRRLVGDANADTLWERHTGEDVADQGAAEVEGRGLADEFGDGDHEVYGCTGSWETDGAFGRRCSDCKASMAPLVPPVTAPDPGGEVWTRNRCPKCDHTASGVRVIFTADADERAREGIRGYLRRAGYFKED